eukprot:TRINITY_DN5665_c1_g2_i1.p1 TRINITY_DN5665_c1_g2~~TRINITY_DN5665_c1_g2_i1.p1  ORF type:complete len:196 (+),score=12.28 TRINITY_DN5665_c1_g2_i1:123-710(+)
MAANMDYIVASVGCMSKRGYSIFHDYFNLAQLVKSRQAEQEDVFTRETRDNSPVFTDSSLDRFSPPDSPGGMNMAPWAGCSERLNDWTSPLASPSSPLWGQKKKAEIATARRGKSGKVVGAKLVCVFCRNNGEDESVYTSHALKAPDGRVTCPVLRAYTCPLCHASGDEAHTIKYCPTNANNLAKQTNPSIILSA